jgi:threonine dehydrogenase-like Zn-dependent dehydrogenase
MGATKLIGIDHVPERLELARTRFGADVIDYDDEDAFTRVMELTHRRGADATIDATGFRYAKKVGQQVQRAIGMQTDSIDALSEAIKATRKGGIVVPIADFVGYANKFPIGAMMEKGLTMVSSQIHPHKYWERVMEEIRAGRYDPTFTLTHKVPLEKAPEMYEKWDEKKEGIIKVMLRP